MPRVRSLTEDFFALSFSLHPRGGSHAAGNPGQTDARQHAALRDDLCPSLPCGCAGPAARRAGGEEGHAGKEGTRTSGRPRGRTATEIQSTQATPPRVLANLAAADGGPPRARHGHGRNQRRAAIVAGNEKAHADDRCGARHAGGATRRTGGPEVNARRAAGAVARPALTDRAVRAEGARRRPGIRVSRARGTAGETGTFPTTFSRPPLPSLWEPDAR